MLEFISQARNLGIMNEKSTPVSDAIALFDVYNRSEGKSPATLDWYYGALKILSSHDRGLGPEIPMGQITEAQLRGLIAALAQPRSDGRVLKPASLNNYVRAWRSFFRWAHDEGYTEAQLLGRLRPPKIPRELVEVLSDEETARLLRTVASNPRDHAIMTLFLDAGLRASELCGVRVKDVSLEDCTVKVMGKGSKERIVPFGNTAKKVLLDYVARDRPVDGPTDHLFFSCRSTPITRETIKQLMERVGRRAGIKRLHAHLLRHSYATAFLLAGGSSLMLNRTWVTRRWRWSTVTFIWPASGLQTSAGNSLPSMFCERRLEPALGGSEREQVGRPEIGLGRRRGLCVVKGPHVGHRRHGFRGRRRRPGRRRTGTRLPWKACSMEGHAFCYFEPFGTTCCLRIARAIWHGVDSSGIQRPHLYLKPPL